MVTTRQSLACVAAIAAASAALPVVARPATNTTRVIVSTQSNMSGPRRICLTPHANGEAVINATLKRRTCLSTRQWALRGFRVLED
ncbi:hypothetical protein [Sphingomonas alpina]|uniref:UrcA family protein n=1 Tax=Sphingomonas alpina TaxID=653931 RepID=A0A7H0LLB7_9SPHN|nr:hypothetical protein [Sphingomonas alpina]QNQ10470.1 hypothetical protein H3Z74_04415 [Sphingomonas alpina]